MRSTLSRFGHVVGFRSSIVIVTLLFTSTIAQVLLDTMPHGMVGEWVWVLFLGTATLVVFYRWDRQYRHNLTTKIAGQPNTSRLGERRGVIVLLGLDSHKPEGSIARLLREAGSLDHLALLGTPETADAGVAGEILSKLVTAAGHKLSDNNVFVWEHGDNGSVVDFDRATADAIDWMFRHGLDCADIVVDITRGRRTMGYGAQLAAQRADVEVQYLAHAWDPVAHVRIQGKSAFKLLVDLHGDIEASK